MADAMTGQNVRTFWDGAAQSFAEREFLVFVDPTGREARYTYRAFNGLINQCANMFAAMGVAKGDIVCVHLCSSVDFMVCLFGIAKIGAIMVPVNEQSVHDEALYVLDKCRPRVVVTEPSFFDLYRGIQSENPELVPQLLLARCDASDGGARNLRDDIALQPDELATVVPLSSDDVCEVMYTSGTTSAPKGVEFTHANMLYAAYYTQWQVSLRGDDRLLTTMPACHSNFQLAAMMPVIAAGATLVLVEKYSAHRFWGQVRRYHATVFQAVSMIVRTLLLQPPSERDRDNDVREVMYFLPLDTESKDEFESRFNVRLLNSYGSTESLTWVLTDYPTGERRWPSVGRVGLGYEVRIADENDLPLPPGEVGEVQIRGVRGRTIMKGYFRDEAATNAAFTEDGWFKSGDKAYCDADGFFYFADRKSNMIKRAGENISATEIENVLLTDDRIAEAAVVGRDDPIRDQMVVAYVVPARGAALAEDDVLAFCRAHLAAFKVPSEVHIRTELPHTVSMKVEKKRLR
jgi:crotonobetaine/carnitine-CoA ligase